MMESKTNLESIQPDRAEKHIEMHSAIQRIGSLEDHVQEILSRIIGEPCEKKGEAKQSDPSLYDVLSGGPMAIHEKVTRIHELLGKVTEAIF